LVFEKNAIFAKNWQKSPKNLIITSTPGLYINQKISAGGGQHTYSYVRWSSEDQKTKNDTYLHMSYIWGNSVGGQKSLLRNMDLKYFYLTIVAYLGLFLTQSFVARKKGRLNFFLTYVSIASLCTWNGHKIDNSTR
jgi:hypothetical protein